MDELSNTDVPGSRRGVINKLLDAPDDVKWFFKYLEELIERFPWEVSLSYAFSQVEKAHIMTLYCGVVKLHRVKSELAKKAVDNFENRDKEFRNLYEKIFGSAVNAALSDTLDQARHVRNRALHGHSLPDREFRKAITKIIDYAAGFNQQCHEIAGFQPFGRRQGFKGAGKSLDNSTSRWLLKGIGFPLQ